MHGARQRPQPLLWSPDPRACGRLPGGRGSAARFRSLPAAASPAAAAGQRAADATGRALEAQRLA
eukprot:2378353-Lingulodinium_polyedra.AAC.1